MLQAFVVFMATTRGGDRGLHEARPHVAAGRGGRKRSSATAARRRGPRDGVNASSRPPRPNHFISVRIDNSQVWEKVKAVQDDIIESQPHLQDAAIPLQDLHLTLFVATLHEEDGTLQRAKETLEGCGDILREHGVCREDRRRGKEAPAGRGASSTKRSDESSPPSARDEQGDMLMAPLTLSFRGLADFNNKVLYACLVEDEHAAGLRRLASAMHERFSRARVVDQLPSSTSGDAAREGSSFEFQPHLTVMKTSRLSRKGAVIPPSCYDRHRGRYFGSHGPFAVELSSMLEKEEVPSPGAWGPQPYYKCEQRLAFCCFPMG